MNERIADAIMSNDEISVSERLKGLRDFYGASKDKNPKIKESWEALCTIIENEEIMNYIDNAHNNRVERDEQRGQGRR